MADLTGQVRELARVFADSGLSVLHAICHRGGMSLHKFDSAGRPGRVPSYEAFQLRNRNSDQLFEALRGLEELLRPAGEERPLVVELRLDGSGDYEFRHSFELESMSPTRLVLDLDYHYPHHPRPGMPAPAGAGVTDRPTDPAVLATVRDLIDEYVRQYTEIQGRAPGFGGGYSEEGILAAETAMGLRLPEDVRALYRMVRDDSGEHGLLGRHALFSLESVVAEYLEGSPGSCGWNDGLFTIEPVVFEAYPAGLVRRVSRSDWWVTIASDFSGDYCAVDLDPAPHGTPGQLIEYGRNVIGPVGYVADSVTAVLRQVVAAPSADAYEVHPDAPHQATMDHVGDSGEAEYSEVPDVGDRPVAAVVADLADPLAVQELYLNDPGAVDLAELAPLNNLRALNVNRAAAVDLALPHHLPVESLSVEATTVADLASLAGHPTLWHLTLKALGGPVSIEPLATLPALAYLNLSAVEVTDLELVAALPQLRVLALNHGQWRYLRDRDALPIGLAAAELCGHTPLADAIAWTTWLDPARPVRPAAPPIRGTF